MWWKMRVTSAQQDWTLAWFWCQLMPSTKNWLPTWLVCLFVVKTSWLVKFWCNKVIIEYGEWLRTFLCCCFGFFYCATPLCTSIQYITEMSIKMSCNFGEISLWFWWICGVDKFEESWCWTQNKPASEEMRLT